MGGIYKEFGGLLDSEVDFLDKSVKSQLPFFKVAKMDRRRLRDGSPAFGYDEVGFTDPP